MDCLRVEANGRLAKVLFHATKWNKSSNSQIQHQIFQQKRKYDGLACKPRLRTASTALSCG